jgi:hypothetical protein
LKSRCQNLNQRYPVFATFIKAKWAQSRISTDKEDITGAVFLVPAQRIIDHAAVYTFL